MDTGSTVSKAELGRWINELVLLDAVNGKMYSQEEWDERRAAQRSLVEKIVAGGDEKAQRVAAIFLRDRHTSNARRAIADFFE